MVYVIGVLETRKEGKNPKYFMDYAHTIKKQSLWIRIKNAIFVSDRKEKEIKIIKNQQPSWPKFIKQPQWIYRYKSSIIINNCICVLKTQTKISKHKLKFQKWSNRFKRIFIKYYWKRNKIMKQKFKFIKPIIQ